MFWMDYTIQQAGDSFKILGDWEGEVMGMPDPERPEKQKENWLYRPGDIYRVNENGWLVKIGEDCDDT